MCSIVQQIMEIRVSYDMVSFLLSDAGCMLAVGDTSWADFLYTADDAES